MPVIPDGSSLNMPPKEMSVSAFKLMSTAQIKATLNGRDIILTSGKEKIAVIGAYQAVGAGKYKQPATLGGKTLPL